MSAPAPERLDRRWAVATVAVCLVGAVALLAVPATLAYDPWAWLVWGREVVGLDLDTTGGPSWKPGPVLVATAVVPLGSAGPTAWLVLARTAALLGVVGAYHLARRLTPAGPRVAGAAAAALLLLTPDAGPRFARLLLEGHSAAVTAGLALWAVDRHLAGQPRSTLWLLFALSLDRPEAWPFLGLYAAWSWRAQPSPPPRLGPVELVAAVALVPALWLGGDWWGSGSALHGAGAAQDVPDAFAPIGGAVERAVGSVIAPVWVAALAGTAVAGWRWRQERRAGDPLAAVAALTGLALAWYGVVLGMNAALGFAALGRFFLPAAALLCVAATVAVAEAVRSVPAPAWRPAVACGAVALALPAVVGRAANLPATLEAAEARARADDGLADLIAEVGGASEVRACAPLSIDTADVPRPALAWRAGVPLGDVRRTPPSPPAGTMVVRTGGTAEAEVAAAGAGRAEGNGEWSLYRVPCR